MTLYHAFRIGPGFVVGRGSCEVTCGPNGWDHPASRSGLGIPDGVAPLFLFPMVGMWMVLDISCGVAVVVCYILALIKMFQHDDVTMAVVCIVTTPFGMGPVMASFFFLLSWFL